jgi:uncharacterized metal-binding protein
MKIKFWCDNNANVHSKKTVTFTLQQLGYTKEDWNDMTDEEKNKAVYEWAMDNFDYGYEEVE